MSKRSFVASAALMLGLAAATFTLPAHAQISGEFNFQQFFKMADKNGDGMVTRTEFMDAMGKVYDMKMDEMKKSKDGAKMMKGDAMNMEGIRSIINGVHTGA